MPESALEISVCLCTYKRPDKLSDCLMSLVKQTFSRPFEIIVTDNDCHRSGEKIVCEFKETFQIRGIPISYLVEPVQNISFARNRCVQAAQGNLVAFIDDDEHASPYWLETLYQILLETDADGVWGPVIPDIPESFPEWMRDSKLFQRPTQKDKSAMQPDCMRTGNAMIKRFLLGMRPGPFREELGKTGGSDTDLFTWLQQKGFKFVWAAHAEVIERIEEKRRHLRWHVKRGYRGGWAYSLQLAERYGRFIGFLLSIGRIIPATFKALFLSIRNIHNIREAMYILAYDFSGHVGKVGFFMSIKVEEYR